MGQINGETQPSVLSSVGPACAFDGFGFGFTGDCDDFRLSWMGKYSGEAVPTLRENGNSVCWCKGVPSELWLLESH